jgi:acyl dehydratase
MLDYGVVRNWRSAEIRQTVGAKDAILYALGVGAGQDPMDVDALRLVTENGLRALPSMAAVLCYPGFWMRDHPGTGIDAARNVHGEQSVVLHRPLPLEQPLVGVSRVTRVVDKGRGKGAVVHVAKEIREELTGEPVATCESVVFCRGDGGFSEAGTGDPPAAAPPATPDADPEFSVDLQTRPEAALVYRLSGDYNPLHSDPAVAVAAGFPRPILHGLATYGAACRGLVASCCGHDPTRLRSIRARFSAPTYPGDLVRLEGWRSGEEVAFRATVPTRSVVVLSHGRATCG